ncbi:MAG: DUF1653 domain-containing protein [Clostridiales bacterium]|nr:DUF1653 domain-containing protein [Clostridiales bacterium]
MAQGDPIPGEQYLHFKNRRYQVIAVAYHSETMEKCVVYQALYGDFKVYVRPYEMFVSEVDHAKYPDVAQKYRFQYLEGEGQTASDEIAQRAQKIQEVLRADESNKKTANIAGVTAGEERETANDAGEESGETLNPWLERFLDAEDFDEKYKLVCDMQRDVTDRLIDDIAVVMDLAIPEGDLAERYAQLKYCMRTRQRYEQGRLR